ASMAASRETEIKLPVPRLSAIRRKLKSRGFRVLVPRRFESNWLFDFPDKRLRKSRSLLRLRFVDGECLLTFKGPPLASRLYKVRVETETPLADGEAARQIFRGLGLREAFRYDKHRTTYARRGDRRSGHRPLVELDETPIGNFLELEGPATWIDAVARDLDYQRSDYVTASYAALYFDDCRRKHRRPQNMVFAGRR
ncbi:MAG TPA: class IV adenylate cyclase, partial [Terriglobia bacterium]|nr:class IV adenylate cyclase [Terriglobia bacterium]